MNEWANGWINEQICHVRMYMHLYVHTNVNVYVHMSNENGVKRGGWCPVGMSIKIDDLYQTPCGDVSHLTFWASYFYTTWDGCVFPLPWYFRSGMGWLTLINRVSIRWGASKMVCCFTCWRVSSVGDRPIKIIPNPLVTAGSAGIVITTLRSESIRIMEFVWPSHLATSS